MKNKVYNFRIYPNQEQSILLTKTFGCVRKIYNLMLNERQEVYQQLKDDKDALYSYNYRTESDYKTEYDYMLEVDSIALQQSRLNLQNAYKAFFSKQNKFPKFKNKHNRQSYRTVSVNKNLKVDFEDKKIKLPKLGWIKYSDNRTFEASIRSITISRNKAGNYFAAILVQEDIQHKQKLDNVLGIDLNIEYFAVVSTGQKVLSPKYYQKTESKLAIEQKRLSRKKKGSNNKDKQRLKVAKLYQKIRNQKVDFLHKLSTKIIDENQIIVLEDLNIKDMLQNKYLSKSIQQQNWYEFVSMLKYKADWYGREVIQADRYFPSSQLCSNCGYRNENLKLSDRQWQCPDCETFHDRDINAAINLTHTVGTAEINACGDKSSRILHSAQESTSFRA